MKYIVLVARLLLGGVFFVLGLEHFLHFINPPMPELPAHAASFMGAMGPTKYMDVIKVIEVVGGAFVLTGLFLPLGLVLLMPIIVNIALFEFLLVGQPGLSIALLVLGLFLLFSYRHYFASVFAIGAKPNCSRVNY